jgi:glycosyltransferase involved in cell wall biosynthesis
MQRDRATAIVGKALAMTGGPLFSVTIPAYNYGRFLRRCLDSVMAQTLSDWEAVVTDDCSTDDTAQVVASFRDPRVRYHRNPSRLGMYPNFRRAVELSKGTHVKPLPADDYLLPHCLEGFQDRFRTIPDLALACAGVEVVDWNDALLERRLLPHAGQTLGIEQVARAVADTGCIFGGNSHYCFRRDLYERVGGYPSRFTYSGDFALCALLVRHGRYHSVNEILIGGRIHGTQSGVRDTRSTVHIEERFRVYDVMFAPESGLHSAARLRAHARKREGALYLAIAYRALLVKGKRGWARRVIAFLTKEMGAIGLHWSLLARSVSVLCHFRRSRRPAARRIAAARRAGGVGLPSSEPDPSVGRYREGRES